jgi:TrmH family RNA methyltransferase
VQLISSRRHPLVTQFRHAARTTGQLDSSVLLEGPRLVADALDADVSLTLAAVTKSSAVARRTKSVVDRLLTRTRVIQVTPSVMNILSPAATPSGLVALGNYKRTDVQTIFDHARPFVVALNDVQDPGNVGAVIRSAEAGGATGVITVGGANPFGWKALRGSMGSAFRLPVISQLTAEAVSHEAQTRGWRVIAATPRGGTNPADLDLTTPCLVWLGTEGEGLSKIRVHSADDILSVPMTPPVESLNIAVTAAVIIYEAARQRRVG